MVTKSELEQPARTSHLFMLRLWPEELGSGQVDWRGSVQHVNSGEVRYFRSWPTFEAFVDELLRGTDAEGPVTDVGGHIGKAPSGS